MEGKCSECGLDFAWANLLSPQLRRQPWLYEHAKRWWSLGPLLRTFIESLMPWRFWRLVRVHHQVRPNRLVIWLLLVPLLIALTTTSVSYSIVEALISLPAPTRISAIMSHPNRTVLRTGKDGVTMPDGRVTLPLPPSGGWTSHTVGDDLVVLMDSTAPARRIAMPRGLTRDTPIDPRWLFDPGFPYDVFIRVWRGPAWSAPPGLRGEALCSAFAPATFEHLGEGAGVRVAALFILLPAAFSLCAALVILVAPSHWRRARVRPVHLLRATAHSLAPAVILYFAFCACSTTLFVSIVHGRFTRPSGFSPLAESARSATDLIFIQRPPLLTLAILAWLCAFWWFALRRGLELKNATLLWLFACLAGGAGAANLLVIISILRMNL